MDENKALPPKQLQKKLSAMLEQHPDIAEAVSGHGPFNSLWKILLLLFSVKRTAACFTIAIICLANGAPAVFQHCFHCCRNLT